MFIFQHSQINQKEFHQLAELLLNYHMVYATSKFDVGKKHSPLHFPIKPDAFFKQERAFIVPKHLQEKVVRLLSILEQYENISPVNKKNNNPKDTHSSTP